MSRDIDENTDDMLTVDLPDIDEEEVDRDSESKKKGTGEIKLKEIPGLAELEASHTETQKTPTRTYTLILLILLAFTALVYILTEMREKSLMKYYEEEITVPVNNTGTASAAGATTAQGPGASAELASAPILTPQPTSPPKLVLTQDLSGTAVLKTREKGPLFSAEMDPEVAALGEALRRNVENLFGVKTSEAKNGTITEKISGQFQGFRVTGNRVKNPGEIVKDEIIINTPSKGTFTVRSNILDAVNNLTYEKLYQDLDESGIRVNKTSLPAEGKIKISLEIINVPITAAAAAAQGVPKQDKYLISGQTVGPVKINMTISEMKSMLPSKYNFVRKSFQYGGEFYNLIKVFDENQRELFFVNEKDNKVWGIEIINKEFRTAKGIGIGSTLGTLRVYYANPKIWFGAGSPLVSVSDIDGVFILDNKGIDFDRKIFPNSTIIKSILIGGSPFLSK